VENGDEVTIIFHPHPEDGDSGEDHSNKRMKSSSSPSRRSSFRQTF
jgi:hypothetical protein